MSVEVVLFEDSFRAATKLLFNASPSELGEAARAEAKGILLNLNPDIFRFRHRVFVEHAGWNLDCPDGFERDQFDVPGTIHLVCKNSAGAIEGITRLLPTTQPYMLEVLWPNLLDFPPPKSPKVWEITRSGMEPNLSVSEKIRVGREMTAELLRLGLEQGIEFCLAVMPPNLAKAALGAIGWPYQPCGELGRIEELEVQAIRLEVNQETLDRVSSLLRPKEK